MNTAVFLGGGHAHVLALLQLAGKMPRGARALLISEDDYSPYSGMLPGYVAGHYRREDCFINLPRLAKQCGADFMHARAKSIDADARELILENGARQTFSLLSVNIGSIRNAPFDNARACAVKPTDPFMNWLNETPEDENGTAIIGAGAAGVEIALSMRAYSGRNPPPLAIVGRRFLPNYPAKVQEQLRELLKKRKVNVCIGEASAYDGENITLRGDDKTSVKAGRVIFATGAVAPPILKTSGAKTTSGGYLQINKRLQSVSHPHLFAAGDCAECEHWQLQKSGVVAVRQAPVLARNILAFMRGKNGGAEWKPPRAFLAIIGEGGAGAFACYGERHLRGKLAWRWKRFLDLRFMRRVGALR